MAECPPNDPLGPLVPSPDADCCDLSFDGTLVTDANPLPVTLDGGDIEIGAVEIKAGTNDNRADVDLPANITSADLALAVHDAATAGTAAHTADQVVAAASIPVLAANAARKSAIVQNVGAANLRVAIGAAAAPGTGLQLAPGQSLVIEQPYCPTAVINAIREGAVSSSVSVLEVI